MTILGWIAMIGITAAAIFVSAMIVLAAAEWIEGRRKK